MNFFKTPAVLKYVYPNLLWDKKKEEKKKRSQQIYLTFDDGPIPDVTEFVLDTLQTYQAKGTFFCVGNNVERHPQLYQRILREGHVTGNHTHHHLNGWETNDQDYFNDIRQCEASLIKYLTEQIRHEQDRPDKDRPEQDHSLKKLFRPPHGKIRKSQIHVLKHEYTIVMWDILSGDFDQAFNEEKCLEKCIANTTAGTIIIFHDSYKAAKNLRYVLPRYMEHFASAGFQFSTL